MAQTGESYQQAQQELHRGWLVKGLREPRCREDLECLSEGRLEVKTPLHDRRCKEPTNPQRIISWASPNQDGVPRYVLAEFARGATKVLEKGPTTYFDIWPWSEWFDGIVVVPPEEVIGRLGYGAPNVVMIARTGAVVVCYDDSYSEWESIEEMGGLFRVPGEQVRQWPSLSDREKADLEIFERATQRGLAENQEAAVIDIYPKGEDSEHERLRKMALAREIDVDIARAIYPENDY